ncbi:uncharacterized protein LOC144343711 [Saccoglossus kowalevskii]
MSKSQSNTGPVIKWSKKVYTLKHLIKHFELPQIVKVISGWHGNDNCETISSGQIIRIANKFSQSRVVAEDELKRHVSIPRDYPFKFEILPIKDDVRKTFTVEEILEKFSLPQKIRMDKQDLSISIDGTEKMGYSFGNLTLLRSHDITYLGGNSMTLDSISKMPLILPMYILAEVAVAEGLVGGTKTQWKEWKFRRTQFVESNVDFTHDVGQNDISIYGTNEVKEKKADGQDIYEEIEPKMQVRIRSRNDYETLPNLSETQGEYHTLDEYDFAKKTEPPVDTHKQTDAQTDTRPPLTTQVSFDSLNYAGLGKPETQSPYQELVPGMKPSMYKRMSLPSKLPPNAVELVSPAATEQVLPQSKPLLPPPDYATKDVAPARPEKPVPAKKPLPARKPESATQNATSSKTTFPDNLHGISVAEVCECLESLQMSQYVKTFKENTIDGDILCSLDTSLLTGDLGMSAFHALKLNKFISGWRPKIE